MFFTNCIGCIHETFITLSLIQLPLSLTPICGPTPSVHRVPHVNLLTRDASQLSVSRAVLVRVIHPLDCVSLGLIYVNTWSTLHDEVE
jgi:hypothetical protein